MNFINEWMTHADPWTVLGEAAKFHFPSHSSFGPKEGAKIGATFGEGSMEAQLSRAVGASS